MLDLWFYSANAGSSSLENFMTYLDTVNATKTVDGALVLKRGIDIAYTAEVQMVGVAGLLWLLRVTRDIATRDRIASPPEDPTRPSETSKWAKSVIDSIVPQNRHMQQIRPDENGDPQVIREKLAEPIYGVSNRVGFVDRYVGDFLEGPIRFL